VLNRDRTIPDVEFNPQSPLVSLIGLGLYSSLSWQDLVTIVSSKHRSSAQWLPS